MSTFRRLEEAVISWAEDRQIIAHQNPSTALLKSFSEMGELADATIKNDLDGIVDGVGDILVTLIIYCALKRINMTTCLEAAYNEIKHRTGTMLPNGVFVKDSLFNISVPDAQVCLNGAAKGMLNTMQTEKIITNGFQS